MQPRFRLHSRTLCTFAVLLAATAALVFGRGTLVNPVAEGADPWVLREGDTYYWCFSDGNRGVAVHRSSRLQSLGSGRVVWTAPDSGPHSREIWAPELHHFGDRWYVYVAASNGENKNHRMIVLESATSDPLSDYRFKSELYTGDHIDTKADNRWAIDLTVFELRGQRYAVWSGWADERDEQWLYAAPISNPWTISGNRVQLCDNDDYLWERVDEKLSGRGLHEAPEILRHGERVFLVYSTSGSWQPSYKLGMLELERGADPLKPGAWKKLSQPVFTSTEQTFGVGHCCFVTSPDGHEDWLVYHAKMLRTNGWQRALHEQPFTWTADGRPDFGVPVDSGRPLPAPSGEAEHTADAHAPFTADFARGLQGWDTYGHHQLISITRDGLRIGHSRGKPVNVYRCGEKLLAAERTWRDGVVETRLKIDAKGEAGVLLRVTSAAVGREAQQGYFVGVQREPSRVRLVRFDGGTSAELAAGAQEFAPAADDWHALRVRAQGPEISVELDGKIVLRAKDERWKEGTAGVRVAEGEAQFATFAMQPLP